MTTITPEQRRAISEAGDSAIELADPQTGASYVLIPADLYRHMKGALEEQGDRSELEAWAKLARKARNLRAAEDPY